MDYNYVVRDYLVRAKTKELTPEWVTGLLVYDDYIRPIPFPNENVYNAVFANATFSCRVKIINEKTLSRNTGKEDKNGKLVFEGDILKADVKGVEYIGRVEFEHGSWIFNPCGDLDYCPLFDFMDINLKVIGNIFDNPELLEVRT